MMTSTRSLGFGFSPVTGVHGARCSRIALSWASTRAALTAGTVRVSRKPPRRWSFKSGFSSTWNSNVTGAPSSHFRLWMCGSAIGFSNLKWEDGAPVTFEFHVELKPDLKLERLGSFRVARKVAAVTTAQVDAQLNAMREQRAPWTPVTG